MKKTAELIVKVRYPKTGGRIVLRTEEDWEKDLEPSDVREGGTLHEFRLVTERPYIYFKPCLVEGEEFLYAQGPNFLAITGAPEQLVVYPYFHVESRSTISDLEMVACDGECGRKHGIRIYYPAGYEENVLRHYPVLYMQDGHNLFFPEESFAGTTWQVERTLKLLDDMKLLDKILVVGIYPGDRVNDYTKPGYESYGRFLVNHVKPLVDGRCRTMPDAQNTGVMGSSLGGVVSLYLAWQYPEVFGKAACLSSTFTFQDDLMERIATEPRRDLKIYLDSGWPGDNFEVTRAMFDLLLKRGYLAGKDLMYFAFPEAGHSEGAWAMRAHLPFQFLFARHPQFEVTDQNLPCEPTESARAIAPTCVVSLPERPAPGQDDEDPLAA